MPKLEDRWSLGLWLGKSLASDEHNVGTSAGVRRCRSIWRRPENQRWSKKVLNESLEPNTVEGETTHTTRSVHHAGPSDQVWTHNRMPSMLRACESASSECRARFQDIVDSEAAQTGAAIAGDTSAEVWGQVPGNFATSSSSGPAPVAGRPAPEDVMEMVVKSSTTQPTSSANWVLEADDHPSAKRQKVLAGMPTSDETDEDVNVDAYKIIVLAAMPDDREQWTQQIVDWDKKYFGTKSGTLLDTQGVPAGVGGHALWTGPTSEQKLARLRDCRRCWGRCRYAYERGTRGVAMPHIVDDEHRARPRRGWESCDGFSRTRRSRWMIGGERGYHRHATVMTSRAASAESETLRVAMNRARGSSSQSFCAHCGTPCLVLARAHATTKHHGNVPCLVHPSMHVCDKVTGRFQ